MSSYNDNNAYLSINGRVLGAASGADSNIFITGTTKVTTGDEETTKGSGVDWEDHDPKLAVIDGTWEIGYETTTVSTDLTSILNSLGRGDVVEIIWGPEGNTGGQPKHQQDFLITGVDGPKIDVKKARAMFSISGKSKGTPTSNMYAGDTW